MPKAELDDRCSPPGSASPTSTQRVAKWRERERRGVLFVANLEVIDRDLRVLKHFGHLASDDPSVVGKDDFGNALSSLLDHLARRLGVFGAGSDAPAKGSV
jgi:hypothetical protein